MTERFIKGYCCGDVGLVDKEKEEWFVENINSISDLKRNWNDVLDKLNEVAEENRELKHNNKMLSMKMSEVYTKYCLLNEFSEDTNPNDAVKRVLSELMQITKEYR